MTDYSKSRLISILFILSFFIVVGGSFWRYYFEKEYFFNIETSCNPETELCFNRSCADGECPPNNFENYRKFQISAKYFDQCDYDGCENFCKNEKKCIEIVCKEGSDECSGIR